MERLNAAILVLALSAGFAFSQDAIKELEVTPAKEVFNAATADKPLEIKSKEDAAKYFGKDQLEALTKAVDFKKQVVLVFAWRGSGKDKLETIVRESYPESIIFSRKFGRTRDLRPHVKVFALRSNVRWRVSAKK